jgi:chitinase
LIGQLVPLAHKQNVKVLISVGGWGWDDQFEKMAANPSTRTAFVKNLVKIVALYQFDGADIDWEYPDAGPSAQNFLALMQELRAALPKGSLLTAAVVALGDHGAGIPSESFAQMDFVNIMAYDDSGPQHSSLNYAVTALDYWLERGLPPEKATLGVPFYARPTETPYAQIVKDNPAAAQLDSTLFNGVQINYNGIPTIQAKTHLALQRASGIMFWTLENDASGDLSLLSAIHQVVVNAKN